MQELDDEHVEKSGVFALNMAVWLYVGAKPLTLKLRYLTIHISKRYILNS